MRVIVLACSPIENDPRIRKSGKWLKQMGHEVIYIEGWHSGIPPDTVLGDAGFLDGCKKMHASLDRALMLRGAILALKPDAVHMHETAALWPMMAVFDTYSQGNLQSGKRKYEAGIRCERPPIDLLVYDAHEWERGRAFHRLAEHQIRDHTYIESACIHLCDHVFVVSEAIQKRMVETYALNTSLSPSALPREAHIKDPGILRRRFGIGDDERVIVYSGNAVDGRQLNVMIEACGQMGWRPAFVGKNLLDASLNRYAVEAGAIFVGHQPYPYWGVEGLTLLDWLAGADVGVNCTDMRWESYRLARPNKFHEYAASSIPCVASDQADVAKFYGLHPELGSIWRHDVEEFIALVESHFDQPRPSPTIVPRWEDCLEPWSVYDV